MADCLMKKSQKKTYFNICLKAYLNLYLLQKTIFGNVALSTGVVFEISVVDTVASWYVLSVLKKDWDDDVVSKTHLLDRKRASTRTVKIVTDQNTRPKEEAF